MHTASRSRSTQRRPRRIVHGGARGPSVQTVLSCRLVPLAVSSRRPAATALATQTQASNVLAHQHFQAASRHARGRTKCPTHTFTICLDRKTHESPTRHHQGSTPRRLLPIPGTTPSGAQEVHRQWRNYPPSSTHTDSQKRAATRQNTPKHAETQKTSTLTHTFTALYRSESKFLDGTLIAIARSRIGGMIHNFFQTRNFSMSIPRISAAVRRSSTHSSAK